MRWAWRSQPTIAMNPYPPQPNCSTVQSGNVGFSGYCQASCFVAVHSGVSGPTPLLPPSGCACVSVIVSTLLVAAPCLVSPRDVQDRDFPVRLCLAYVVEHPFKLLLRLSELHTQPCAALVHLVAEAA